jgi:hypothetical protein
MKEITRLTESDTVRTTNLKKAIKDHVETRVIK